MAWYTTGTVAVTNGSKAVTGSGTGWFGGLQAGWGFVGPDGRTYEISTVNSATSITLKTNYLGSTASGQGYAAFPTMSLANDIAERINTLIADYQAVKDGPGQGKFPFGIVTAPGMRFEGDEDTGVRRSGANALALVAGGVDQLALVGGVASGAAVQSSTLDSTTGKLLKAGAFGIGRTGPFLTPPGNDLNNANGNGWYNVTNETLNSPIGSHGVVRVDGRDVSRVSQTVYRGDGTNSNQSYTRTQHGGGWTPWATVYTQASVLGPVAQASGVPTGALIEKGSNANGEYVRFADGTQICTNGNSAIVTAPAAFVGTITKIDGNKQWSGRWF